MAEHGYARPEGDTTTASADPLEGFPGILDCVHCGLCLNACPTYRVTGDETDSPRGRIFLLRAAAEGRLQDAEIAEPIDRCVLCRACEPVCPSKVPYHRLVERHREGRPSGLLRWGLRSLLPSRPRLRVAGFALRLMRTLGLLGLAERFGPRRWRALAGAVPGAPQRWVPEADAVFAARSPRRGRVALHLGCVNAELFGNVLRDCVDVLTDEGFEVHVPAQPACCGALHAHSGDAAHGRQLAQRTLDALDGGFDAAIVPAAGCAAHLHEYDPARGVQDPLVFLADAGRRADGGKLALRVAYDPPCHLQNVLGRADAVAEVLAAVPGVRLVDHAEADLCCGAGGISFARQPEISDQVLERKLERLEQAGPDCVVSGNPGCLLRLESGLRRRCSGIEVLHPISLLARSLRHGAGAARRERSRAEPLAPDSLNE